MRIATKKDENIGTKLYYFAIKHHFTYKNLDHL